MQNYAKKTWSARPFTMYAMQGFSDVADQQRGQNIMI